MKILRASHLGMCFGVRDAIDLAKRTAARTPVTVLGQLAHNPDVLEDLKQQGIRTGDPAQPVSTRTVMITAHGASDKRRAAIRDGGLELVGATCPLVLQAHRELRVLLMGGYYPVVIGKREHVEVIGLTEDLDDCCIIEGPADVNTMPDRPKLGIIAQTTQPIDRVRALVEAIRSRFPHSQVVFMDTVCRPTKERQTAALDLARRCSVVIVVGGRHSNNTHELVQRSLAHCERVYRVEGPNELKPDWFTAEDTVGITAGTSTPDSIVSAVEARLRELDPCAQVAGTEIEQLIKA